MNNLLLVIQGFIALGLVALILLQRSEGGALGMGGGPGGLMSSRSAGNVLTRATTWLAGAFICMCLLLGWQLNRSSVQQSGLDQVLEAQTQADGAGVDGQTADPFADVLDALGADTSGAPQDGGGVGALDALGASDIARDNASETASETVLAPAGEADSEADAETTTGEPPAETDTPQ